MRVVYWHRYDFIGTLVGDSSDAEWRSDTTLSEAATSGVSRLADVRDRHASLADSRNYRAVSEVRDPHDLGGHIEGKDD